MDNRIIQLAKTRLNTVQKEVDGSFVEFDDEKFFRISNYDQMPDFFMSIVSDSDHFMFISSNGALTAGRKNKNNALFPYYTDDKIHDYRDKTGSKSIFLVTMESTTFLWEPFTDEAARVYTVRRNLYKSVYGNKLVFEEVNDDLGLCFRYGWYSSDRFGFIKKASLENRSAEALQIEVLDGLRNILPAGADYGFQNEYSNLMDAYKKNELIEDTTLALFSLSSIPVDRAEPSESLTTTTVWSKGLDKDRKILLSNRQVSAFTRGEPIQTETDIRAERGTYFLGSTLTLQPEAIEKWFFAAEINQDSCDVANLVHRLKKDTGIEKAVEEDIRTGTGKLIQIVGAADGLQVSHEELCSARHFSNALYNVMRGGIFIDGYTLEASDFSRYVEQTSKERFESLQDWLKELPATIDYFRLQELAEENGDPDLIRMSREYFPLTFSRRHGDPSRPWNNFSIENKNPDGSVKLHYEGNWRDIFQNWEALSLSFPGYIEGMISRFVNASTADGYNPYRITREGIDWEIQDPDDPWAYIGYWGDHQIIYLLKFLEWVESYYPGRIDEMLGQKVFVYAHVPYEIKPFEKLVENPKDTIAFNADLNETLQQRYMQTGADGKLLHNAAGQIIRANLAEKLLVTLLAKLSNFIPDAGIWLNTQRPEWNDANNALVGNGTSMVTLYYIRRFLSFWKNVLSGSSQEDLEVSEEVTRLFSEIRDAFQSHEAQLDKGFSDKDRYALTSLLGNAGSNYRKKLYAASLKGASRTIALSELVGFLDLCLKYVDHSIAANKRDDHLYHAYNLVSFGNETISIRYLYEMLEGQVAVLSSGYLSASEGLAVLDALKASALFREDQFSYILYPDRQLTRFIDKNNLPPGRVGASALLNELIRKKNTDIVREDGKGNVHFNPSFRNASLLSQALDGLDKDEYSTLTPEEKKQVLGIYESLFDHQSFTGRSGTFYGYEGLGSIYWHMVSKLLLAVQECYFEAVRTNSDPSVISRLGEHYYEIKAGIGLYKKPDLYGAFPTDAYSHTPGHAGVKQPGLTGQVKEDVISRFGELGIHVKNGQIAFITDLFNRNELLAAKENFMFTDSAGTPVNLELGKDQIGYTFCHVPLVYMHDNEERVIVHFADGSVKEYSGSVLPEKISEQVFSRNDEISRIEYASPSMKRN